MRFLLDTHVWLWLLTAPERLGEATRVMLEDRANAVMVSAVTSWEIAIKYAKGRLALPEPPETYVVKWMRSTGVVSLPVEHRHALRAGSLDMHHRDPFDRLLVAQAQIERVPLISADRVFERYDVELISAG